MEKNTKDQSTRDGTVDMLVGKRSMTRGHRCEHTSSIDIDTICPSCGRSVFKLTYLVYLVLVASFVLIYLDRFTTVSWALLGLLLGVPAFLTILVLRRRLFRLFVAASLIASVFVATALSMETLTGTKMVVSSPLLCFAVYFFVLVFVLSAMGLFDTARDDEIHRGSVWVAATVLLGVLITFIHWLALLAQAVRSPDHALLLFGHDPVPIVLEATELLFRLRLFLLASVSGIVVLVSTIKALREQLSVKWCSEKKGEDTGSGEERGPLVSIIVFVSGFLAEAFGVVFTSLNLVFQILAILGKEMIRVIEDALVHLAVVLVRLVRLSTMTALALLQFFCLLFLMRSMKEIWYSPSFVSLDLGTAWAMAIAAMAVAMLALGAYLMMSLPEWNEEFWGGSSRIAGVKNQVLEHLGYYNDLKKNYRSVFTSCSMNGFYVGLALFGAWTIIIPVEYFVIRSEGLPVGIGYTVAFVMILGTGTVSFLGRKT